MEKDLEVVHVLRQYRHDWLNKIQLIKGYLDLGKMEKVQELINEIILQSRNEGDLSNLKIDRVASHLLTFNWGNHPYVLSFEVIGGERNWREQEELILHLLQETFSILDRTAEPGEENELFLVFKDITQMELEIDFHGQIIDKEMFKNKIIQLKALFQKNEITIDWNDNGYLMTVLL